MTTKSAENSQQIDVDSSNNHREHESIIEMHDRASSPVRSIVQIVDEITIDNRLHRLNSLIEHMNEKLEHIDLSQSNTLSHRYVRLIVSSIINC